MVDAVGGVTVDNDFAFSAEGIDYPKGKQHLNGWEACSIHGCDTKTQPEIMVAKEGNEVMELLINKLLGEKVFLVIRKI